MPLIPDAAKIQKSVAMLPISRYEPGEMVIAAGATTGKLLRATTAKGNETG